jgi:hypothetical protein
MTAPLRIVTTKGIGVDRLKVLVHGKAGAGKTTLAATTGDLDATLVVSAEAGLLSLRRFDIRAVEVTSLAELANVHQTLAAGGHPFRWVVLDSITELAEKCLHEARKATKDPRQAYGELADTMSAWLRAFRDLPFNVVMLAKQARTQDEAGRMLYGAAMPGKQLPQALPYLFDEVFALRVDTDAEGNLTRTLQTGCDAIYDAKDRSGSLALFEPPNLAHIAQKILTQE